MYSINEKVSGRTFVNPNILQLKYGRDVESGGIKHLNSILVEKHKKCEH